MKRSVFLFPVMLTLALMALEQYSDARIQSGDLSANDMIDGFSMSISGKRVAFDYSFTLSGSSGSKMTGQGHVVFQGDSFVQKGNGLETYCDGKSRWTVDRSAMEAVAESVDSSAPDYISYPTFILRDMDKVFRHDSASGKNLGPVSGREIDGQEVVSVKLVPAVPVGKIAYALLSFATGTFRPVALDINLNDGSVLKLSLSGYEVSSASDDSAFSLDPASLGEEFVITDLR